MRESVKLFDALHARCSSTCGRASPSSSWRPSWTRALRRAGHDGVIFQHRWDAKMRDGGRARLGREPRPTMSRGPFTITGVGLSEAFPMGASRREIRRGDLVAVDLGLNRAGYHADMARSYAVGELPDGIAGLAATAASCRTSRSSAIRPGVTAGSVYDATHEAAERLGVGRRLPGRRPVHRPRDRARARRAARARPRATSTPLREGMILAVEPKLISPDFGAVNIEDDVVVTADGCRAARRPGARPVRRR